MNDTTHGFSLWGQAFEIAVKRGLLLALSCWHDKTIDPRFVREWESLDVGDVYAALDNAFAEVDPNLHKHIRETCRHIFVLGMALGQTALRAYLGYLKEDADAYAIRALWLPLQLPGAKGDYETDSDAELRRFIDIMAISGDLDQTLTRRGYPVRADFLLWLEPRYEKLPRELLCIEISLNSAHVLDDYRNPQAHLDELRRYTWFMESRSVFTQVCAEVDHEAFTISPALARHLGAFTGHDKPLFKLCQACSYLAQTARWFAGRGLDDRPLNARALSITQNGLESLSGSFFAKQTDPRVALIQELGAAYVNAHRPGPEASADDILDDIRFALKRIRKALPRELGEQLLELEQAPCIGQDVAFDFSETVSDFANPMTELPWDKALALVEPSPETEAFFGRASREAVRDVLLHRWSEPRPVHLRELHAAAIMAGMRTASPGELRVLGLEANPGIGKTTAVVNELLKSVGFLLLYVSPRVLINDDVTGHLARDRETGEPTGVLTVTTNAKLIGSASTWYTHHAERQTAKNRFIDSAVVVDGVPDLKIPDSSALVLSPCEKEELERLHPPSRLHKVAESDRHDRVKDHAPPGVLHVLSQTTQKLLADNPHIDRVVLTAATQGYRHLGSRKTTIDALSGLFRHRANTRQGIAERRAFAERIGTVVVMVDEVTGDQAGALFVENIARWLEDQFIEPFAPGAPRFRVILIVSDASLGNDVVLDRYLQSTGKSRRQSDRNAPHQAPDKVLIAPSIGNRPFQIAGTPVRLAGRRRPTLHVMTNSYPARSLKIDYRVRMNILRPHERPDGQRQTIRQVMAEHHFRVTAENVRREILRAVSEGADQIIFFAQDKAFLRDLKKQLSTQDHAGGPFVHPDQVAIIDSVVLSEQRKKLISEQRRDKIKVFLMTSSGARGVSFPKADRIIALLPRFNIEAALMEIAQLIYRGRGGSYRDDEGVIRTDGDWKDRHLMFLIQDFIVLDEARKEVLEQQRWMRQVSDLLTFIVLLRATVWTRITGDSGLTGRQLAVVPVGGIGADEMVSSMADCLRVFLAEAEIYRRDCGAHQDRKARVVAARDHAMELFADYRLQSAIASNRTQSIVRTEQLHGFSRHACAENAPLLVSATEQPEAILPDHLYCIGPFWLERWDRTYSREERFSVEGWQAHISGQADRFLGLARFITDDKALPEKLRSSAKDLYKILEREKADSAREFLAKKSINTQSTWLAMPVDYSRFWKADAEGLYPSLDDHQAWRDALGRCLSASLAVMPVIPRYREVPYAASDRTKDPLGFDRIFDNRYFAVSAELNLLNALLLAPEA